MFYRATILSYEPHQRTAQVHIHGLTDGASDGLTATLAYAIGEDDRDTEVLLTQNQDVFVFFEGGQAEAPVIAFYASHGHSAVVDVRRIRQKNIEVLANSHLLLQSDSMALRAKTVSIEAETISMKGEVQIDGDVETKGVIMATGDVIANGKSLMQHTHNVLSKDYGVTSPPI